MNDAIDLVVEGVEKAAEAIETFVSDAYLSMLKSMANSIVGEMEDTLNNFADLIDTFMTENPADFANFAEAVWEVDGPMIKDELFNLFHKIVIRDKAGFDAVIDDIQAQDAGSILIYVAAGASLGISVSTDTGLAIDIDWLMEWLEVHELLSDAYDNDDDLLGAMKDYYEGREFNGVIILLSLMVWVTPDWILALM